MREIDKTEFENVYKIMKKDFFSGELKPIEEIINSFDEGRYRCFVYEREDRILGYATLVKGDNPNIALLDYFAIDESVRGKGFGSKFISDLFDKGFFDIILIEVESVDDSIDNNDFLNRKKRIKFYKNNGAKFVEGTVYLSGHKYGVMAFVKDRYIDIDAEKEIDAIYRLNLSNIIYRKFVKVGE